MWKISGLDVTETHCNAWTFTSSWGHFIFTRPAEPNCWALHSHTSGTFLSPLSRLEKNIRPRNVDQDEELEGKHQDLLKKWKVGKSKETNKLRGLDRVKTTMLDWRLTRRSLKRLGLDGVKRWAELRRETYNEHIINTKHKKKKQLKTTNQKNPYLTE